MSETDARGLPIASLREAFGSTRTCYIFDEKGVREHVEHATKCHLASSQHQRSRRVGLMLHPLHKSGSGGWLRRRCDPCLQGLTVAEAPQQDDFHTEVCTTAGAAADRTCSRFPQTWISTVTLHRVAPGFLHSLHPSHQPSAWSYSYDSWQHFSGRQVVVFLEDYLMAVASL